jgi:hypothetical protein
MQKKKIIAFVLVAIVVIAIVGYEFFIVNSLLVIPKSLLLLLSHIL